jgi:Zn-dependent metalloprotease
MKYLSKLNCLIFIALSFYCAMAFGQSKQINIPQIVNPFKTKALSSKLLQKKVISPAISVVDTTVNTTNRIETVNGSFMLDFKDLSNPIAKKFQKLKTVKTAKGASGSIDFNSWFNLNSNHTFKFINEKVGDSIFSHQYYQQYYKGYRVEGSIIMLHSKNGQLTSTSGKVAEFSDFDTTVIISEEEAQKIAMQIANVTTLQNTFPVETLVSRVPTENGFDYIFAHKVKIESMNPLVLKDMYIDVKTGKLINSINLVAHIDTPATANTLYSGTQTITTDYSNGIYTLKDNLRKIETYDATFANVSVDIPTFKNTSTLYLNTSTIWGQFPYLKSFSIYTVSQNWWYSEFGDTKPDLYIIVKDGANNIIYNGENERKNDVMPTANNPVRFLINKEMKNQPYTVELWDYDVAGDDFGGSYILSNNSGSWSVNGNSGFFITEISSNPALDIHWGMEKTYDYYKNIHLRNSFDGQGATIKNYYNPPFMQGNKSNNAKAIPQDIPSESFMAYGSGDGQIMKPVVGLDVEGHEFTHLVINNNGFRGLKYQGESGALNESFADIFGTCVEFYAKPSTANWTIGEGMMVSEPYMRSMSNPKGVYQNMQPNTYKGSLWLNTNCGIPTDFNDSCGVHRNSGVQNYWFYLLCNGSNGSKTNDLGNVYNVSGISIQKAQRIVYKLLTRFLPSEESSFYDSYNGSLLATEEIFGNPSLEYTAVKNAWFAVGIGNDDPNSYCSGITYITNLNTDPQKNIITDGSGIANYGNNSNCKWVITPAGATKISLNFTAFNTQTNVDRVYVYDGADDTSPLLAILSGNSLPSTISTTNGVGAMCIKFVSDDSITLSGWSATYSALIANPTCSGITTLTTPTGSFNDGSGTANYTNNQQCAWYIAPPCATSVTLNFTTFNTELNFDGIAVYDNLQATNLIGLFSGTSLPTSVTSNTGTMLVFFISNYTNVSQGFSANYTSTGSSYCSGISVLNTSDYGTITDGSGANNYCNNTNCSWLIQPPQAKSISFEFTELDLEMSNSSDGLPFLDYVQIYDGTSEAGILLGTKTGSIVPDEIFTANSGSMYIKFNSDISVTKQGWKGKFISTQTPYCNSVATNFTTATGTLSDGSGTDKYANNSNCAWLIQPTNAKTVTLNFTAFDTELNYDAVIVYDGSNNTAPVLGKFSGSTLPPSLTSTTGNMYVEFLSDEALRSNGWTANYTSTKPSIYNLASTNFKLQVESNSCIGKKTGKISATITNTNYSYQVTVTGVNSYTNTQTVPVGTGTWSITGLEKGKYTICFAIASEPTQKQCFDIEVTEPEPLSVYAKVDNSTGIVNLAMLGAKNYTVSVNGKATSVSSSNFSTILPTGLNSISVTTDKDCQGVYQQDIFISEKAFIYPNPTFGVLHIFVGGAENTISYALTDLSGARIKKSNLSVGETREVEVDLSGIPQGNYIVNINSKTVSQSFKVIKL